MSGRFPGPGRRPAGHVWPAVWLLAAVLLGFGPAAAEQLPGAGELESVFVHPPASARPWVYWFWLDGNISREGITADLEAMRRVGIGGAFLLDVTQEVPAGPVGFGTPEWDALFQHAVAEAARLGLEICLHNAPGWSGSGGPWITPALSMQKVVFSRTNLSGPAHFRGQLPLLARAAENCHDIAVLAFPTVVGDGVPVPGIQPRITTSAGEVVPPGVLEDGDPATFAKVPAAPADKPRYLQLDFPEPYAASLFRLAGSGGGQPLQGALQASDDGKTFKNLREFATASGGVSLEIAETRARSYRVLFIGRSPGTGPLEIAELELVPLFRIASYGLKSGMGPWPPAGGAGAEQPAAPAWAVIATNAILDLTADLDPAGNLSWDTPPGKWTVLRVGYMPIGRENHPARPGGHGLECDKLSREAVDVHFKAFAGRLQAQARPADAAGLGAIQVESWEVGYQNWTPQFREEFRKRRGYDLLRWLPAMSGRIVGGAEQSERFLWDVRRTIADLLAEIYAGRLAELAHERGLKLLIEAYGQGPFDSLQYAMRADAPMAEFWTEPGLAGRSTLCKNMASAAHISGKPIVAAEAFTAYPQNARWCNHPYSLKPLGDAAFCEGVNRLVFHRFAHQRWLDEAPGITMGYWGVQYDRTETWWEQARAWHEYVARCQALLQAGRFVADVCYLEPEGGFDQPPPRARLTPGLPTGYDYDSITAEVLERARVSDGRVRLPDGMSYQLLVLPPQRTMTPGLLRKISGFVHEGLTVVGARPLRSPSLSGYPDCDAELGRIASELWGKCDGVAVKEQVFGKGRIIDGQSLEQVLARLGLAPDFDQGEQQLDRGVTGFSAEQGQASPLAALNWIHRRIGNAECYFAANPNPCPVVADCRFRVSGLRPELWHPDTAEVENLACWREQGRQTAVRLHLDPAGSVFVVFRHPAAGTDPVVSVTRDGAAASSATVRPGMGAQLELEARQPGRYECRTLSGKLLTAALAAPPAPLSLKGPWDLAFPPGKGAPAGVRLERLASWTSQKDPGVKYFSGTATYRRPFEVPADMLAGGRKLFLDLGEMRVIAEVALNGRELGILWKPPFEVEVGRVVRPGPNLLEIKVTNLWPNRLIGDEQLPDDCRWKTPWTDYGVALAEWPQWLLRKEPRPTARVAFTTWKFWLKDAPLLESGLLGPVTLRAVETAPFK